MPLKKTFTYVFFALVCPTLSVFAQDAKVVSARTGLLLGGGLTLHSANFQTLPGVPSCCPRFESGSGLGINFGAYYDLPFSPSTSLVSFIGYNNIGGTLTTTEATTIIVNDLPATGEFQHSVHAKIDMITLSPLVKYGLTNSWSILGGPTFGYIASNTFIEKEELLKPEKQGTFNNGRRIRNEYSGTTPDAAKIFAGITVGTQYESPLNETGSLQLIPHVSFMYGITPVVKGMNWYAHSFGAGVSLQYTLFKEIPVVDTIPPPAPPPPPPPTVIEKKKEPILTAELRAVHLDTAGAEMPIKEIVIEEYIRTQNRPLLNYVFFDEGSSTLPDRYHALTSDEVKSFTIAELNEHETLPLYYEMLNIVGLRMREYPTAKLTIVGCNDDGIKEKGNKALSAARAETVYNYLKTVWEVSPSRMKLESRGLPAKPSSVSDTDGAQENRRVEIHSTVWEVTQPVFTIDTALVPKPSIIRFIPTSKAENGIRRWEVTTSESKKKLKDFSGKDSLADRLDWELEKEKKSILKRLDQVSATLSVVDRMGGMAESNPIVLPVRHYTLADKHREGSIDTIVSRYSLILFDFSRSELGEENKKIAAFVKERILPESRVNINGYTDRIGTDEYNRALSEQRALSTQNYLNLYQSEVKGVGRSILLYDNILPEGRFYSRTVMIIVSTPTKQ